MSFLHIAYLLVSSAAARYLRASDNFGDAAAATPAMPSRALTLEDWRAAAGSFIQIPSRREGVEETLYAKKGSNTIEGIHKCGKPCVAHCIAGQPRDMVHVKGLWKSIKHRLFEEFSESPVVFALLVMGEERNNVATEGGAGYVREENPGNANEDVLPPLEYLGVDRALLLREACHTGQCMQKGLRLKCDGNKLGLTALVDEKTGQYSNMCEIQVSRFRDSLELVRGYEADNNMKFDWVTRPRPDVYWTRPVTPVTSLSSKSVHVSPWAACGYGGMDWFYATPRKYAETLASFVSEVSCSDFKRDHRVPAVCTNCPGCECWMAAWMYKKKIPFHKLPWQWFTPAKFCGTDCPQDWDVTPENIMGVDSRVTESPCERGSDGKLTCPMLITVNTQLHNHTAPVSDV